MDEKCCGKCFYFNGEKGDGIQFCDEKEIFVNERSYCYRYVMNPVKVKNGDEE